MLMLAMAMSCQCERCSFFIQAREIERESVCVCVSESV